jgi:HSP20 family molecular chaperone IbpA
MSSLDPSLWMWVDARRALDRIERLQRRFFEPGRPARQPCWEPPADVFETTEGLFIEVALPGVVPEQVDVTFDGTALVVRGDRRLPAIARSAKVQRLELPYGHFERRIALPAGRYDVVRREIANGCLVLWLRRERRPEHS